MTHHHILSLIENVDPGDSAALDEIDARVWCWADSDIWGRLGPVEFVDYCKKPRRFYDDDREYEDDTERGYFRYGFVFKRWIYTRWWDKDNPGEKCQTEEFLTISKRYTRSLDAQEDIPTDGWNFGSYFGYKEGGIYRFASAGHPQRHPYENPIFTPDLSCEKLARLHAKIQVVAYDRGEA